ncbi:MAG TPA: SLC13 family permease [Bacteroidales bacterium]|nr:SLC13 family permease [Bacteroidales bacterium]HPR57328.1 SLC13 family permease [Bacteroidales bacterium]
MKIKTLFSFVITPAISLILILFFDLEPGNKMVTATLAVAFLMAVWWVTEAVPLAVTSLLPVALFPLLGIMDGKSVSASYFNDVIFLFMGGFIIALAMQRWNLHRRIALSILVMIGTSPGRILLGFMSATAFLSMWISNTATAMMMIPILLSVINKLDETVDENVINRYSIGLLLGVAYSASIGGMATLVGTPPNLSFVRIFQIYFPDAPEISFARWFMFALPITLVFFGFAWVLLYVMFSPSKHKWSNVDKNSLRLQLLEIGPMSYEEKVVFINFISVAILWLFRADLNFGWFTIPGWAQIFPFSEYINDGTVAIFIAVLLFVLPSRAENTRRIMNWKTAENIPWHIILLFGGGFALASGFKESGLSTWFGSQLVWVADYHVLLVIFFISFMMTFLTELTSNTATTEMILPILAGIAISSGINPLLLMLPATLSGSMAFMLPVATPPNAIIFATNRIKVIEMARAGIYLNLAGAAIITVMTYFLATWVFDINLNEMPLWAVMAK